MVGLLFHEFDNWFTILNVFARTKQFPAGMVGLCVYEIPHFERFCSKQKSPAGMVGLLFKLKIKCSQGG